MLRRKKRKREKEEFCECLEETYKKIQKYNLVIIMGDFNARLEKEESASCPGSFTPATDPFPPYVLNTWLSKPQSHSGRRGEQKASCHAGNRTHIPISSSP
jgi:endonuclease/exonuclease/phosphatase family metal-dependent hydrolase